MPGPQKAQRRPYNRTAEAALGRPIPKAWRVLPVNGDLGDPSPVNLVLCDSERTHMLAKSCPELLKLATWLGEPGASVRLLLTSSVQPGGKRYCVRCKTFLPAEQFVVGAGKRALYRWSCWACKDIVR